VTLILTIFISPLRRLEIDDKSLKLKRKKVSWLFETTNRLYLCNSHRFVM